MAWLNGTAANYRDLLRILRWRRLDGAAHSQRGRPRPGQRLSQFPGRREGSDQPHQPQRHHHQEPAHLTCLGVLKLEGALAGQETRIRFSHTEFGSRKGQRRVKSMKKSSGQRRVNEGSTKGQRRVNEGPEGSAQFCAVYKDQQLISVPCFNLHPSRGEDFSINLWKIPGTTKGQRRVNKGSTKGRKGQRRVGSRGHPFRGDP